MAELAGVNYKPYQKVIPVLGPMTEIYPVNILRNIGIAAVETSHFLVADVDTWPSGRIMLMSSFLETLYQNLLKLPKTRLEQDNLAVVLPVFTIPSGREAIVLMDCVNMYEEVRA